MSYRSRNILFFSLVIIFVFLTLVLSLYASGYKFSVFSILQGKMPVQKTGTLILNSNPKGAEIGLQAQFRGVFLEEDLFKKKEIKTPQKIKGLLPGEYLLSLTVDGYWPFEQKINIYPGHSNYIEDIILFKKSLPISFFSAPVQEIEIDSSFRKILLSEDQLIVDSKREKLEEIDLGEKIESLKFLENKRILLNNQVVFDYSKNVYNSVFAFKNNSAFKIKNRGDYLFYLNEEQKVLSSYNLNSQKFNPLFDFSENPNLSKAKFSEEGALLDSFALLDPEEKERERFSLGNINDLDDCQVTPPKIEKKIIDYNFYNNFYFLIEEDYYQETGGKNCFLRIYSYRNKKLLKEFSLPNSDSYEILSLNGSSNFVYIYNQDFQALYIANINSYLNSFWRVINNVSGFNTINNHSLVYFSDFEIYIFDAFLNESFLISRLDKKIKNALWHPKEYIIYSTEQDIIILDLKYENYEINLIKVDEISNLILDKLNSVLYFSAKIGNQEGLYKLFIK